MFCPWIHNVDRRYTRLNQFGMECTGGLHRNKHIFVPLNGTEALYAKLVESGVPAIKVVFPWTEHGFDLLLPQVSPPAQSALYDVDRFLALLLSKD